jgi:hypothetical protein
MFCKRVRNGQKTNDLANPRETKARLLIVGNNVAGRVEKHITLVATKGQLDCADF